MTFSAKLGRITKYGLFSGIGAAAIVSAVVLFGGVLFAEKPEDILKSGDKHFEEKSYLKAFEAYEKVLKDKPTHAERFRMLLRMGHCQAQLGNHDKAEAALTTLADDKGFSDLERARANYRLGGYFAERPHYYYENSKGERSWDRWIADSRYVNVARQDAERSRDRLRIAFDIFEKQALDLLSNFGGKATEALALADEAYNALLDGAAALSQWQYYYPSLQASIDYFDRNEQKQTFTYWATDFRDKDEVAAIYDRAAELGKKLRQAADSLMVQARDFPKETRDAAAKAQERGPGMSALALYRKGCFFVELTRLDDWSIRQLIQHPDLQEHKFIDGKYSPFPIFAQIYKEYHNTPYADDAQYYVGYLHQQVGDYHLAVKAFQTLVDDPAFKESTERSSALAAIQQIQAQRLTVNTVVDDKEVKSDKDVRKWSNDSVWRFRKHVGVNRTIFHPREKLGLWIESRNVKTFTVTARTFDIRGLMKDEAFLAAEAPGFNALAEPAFAAIVEKYVGKEIMRREYETGDDGRNRFTQLQFALPQSLPVGGYVLYVQTDGRDGQKPQHVENQRPIIVTDTQLVVQTFNPSENMALVVDADTGRPLSKPRYIYKRWNSWWNNDKTIWRIDVSRYTGGEDSRLRVPAGVGNYSGYLLYAESGDRFAFAQTGFAWWQQRGAEDYDTYSTRILPMTNRPVYRPGDDVHAKVIVRARRDGEWVNVANRTFRVVMTNPKGEEKFNESITANEFGALEIDYKLAKDAALGSWNYIVRSDIGNNWIGNGRFQVEEYKKPEFEVSVQSPEKPVKLGQVISAKIKGDYYFGGPVAEAEVNYKVYRRFFRPSIVFPRDYDWLYNWNSPRYWGTPDQRFYAHDNEELVLNGTGKLDQNGEMLLEWSSQKALQDWGEWDHQYTIKAEVTDASRRTINGEGSVRALRRAFFVYLDNKLGYYRPGDKQEVEIRTLTADNKPVQVKGELTVSRVTFEQGVDEKGFTKIHEHKTRIRSVNLETDMHGTARFSEVVEGPGTFELTFACKDEYGEVIEGSTRIIVKSDKWMPGSYRFNTLELITQKRVYREREEVGVLLASDVPDAHMLLSIMCGREVVQQTYVNMPAGQQEILLTVDRRHVPNFHINVMTVRNGELHTNTLELYVPPVDQFLNVEVQTDKNGYLPGEKGTVTVKVTDHLGKPVRAEFAATVFDRSLTYIMPETIPNIIKHFYGDLRGYRLNYINSYHTHVWPAHYDRQTYEKHRYYGAPLGWGVKNWMEWERYAFDFNNDVNRSDRYRQGFNSKIRKERGPGDPGEAPEKSKDSGLRDGDYGENWDASDEQEDGVFKRSRGGGGGAAPRVSGAPAPPSAAPAPDAESKSTADRMDELSNKLAEKAHNEGMAAPKVRRDFRDSAFYSHRIRTGADGVAKFEVNFPDNLTDWRIALRGITAQAKVGEAFGSVKVRKNLILRDQAPRFFVENDSVTLSAIVMNSYDHDLEVSTQIQLNPLDTASAADKAAFCKFELYPETPARVDRVIPARREVRIDWRVRMTGAGNFRVRMLAMSAIESDATEKNYNCKVRGAEMYQAVTAVINDGEESNTFSVTLPDKLDPTQTNLDLTLSPSIAALAMDALPYLLEFPYGCVEQTMSRFMPAVLVRKTLRDANISLEDVAARRAQLAYEGKNPQAAYWYKRNPVFDTNTMNAIVEAGLDRLRLFQRSDGGWGWWQYGDSDTYMSSYVVYGLVTAKQAGIQFDYSMIDRGASFIASMARKEKNVHRAAYVAFVLAYAGRTDKELLDKVYDRRDDLSNMSRAMMCMAQFLSGDKERARIQLSNLEDYRQEDKEHGTTWWWGGKEYWCWWNDRIETNAFVMQAFTMVDPTNKHLEKHVKWLAQNRKGSTWSSTKDTSHAVSALMAYARASGELEREYTVTVSMGGKPVKEWHVTPNNIFALQGNLRLTGDQLPPGKHNFTVTRSGKGKVYFSSYLSYFSKEDRLKASNTNEIAIDRKYYKLSEKISEVKVTKKLADGTTAEVMEKRLSYERTLLDYGAKLTSGDLIEVELNITAKNDYEYLAFEDFKPAGCEPVALRSGAGWAGGLCQNVELRDDRVAFFVTFMPQGSARLKYQLRAEIPGTFSALPTQGGSMYVPEIKANSEEWVTTIVDKK